MTGSASELRSAGGPAARMAAFRNVTLVALLALFACARSHADDATILRAELTSMRRAIAHYRLQQGHPPKSLGELVAARLLPSIPTDPITGSATTWKTDVEESVAVNNDFRATTTTHGNPGGIIDVHSGAPGRDDAGKAWSEY